MVQLYYKIISQVPPEINETRKQLFQNFPFVFQREIFFYNSVRELFEKVIEEQEENVDDMLSIIPKPFTLSGHLTDKRAFEEPLVCEDLSSIGFKMWKKEFEGLDLPHSEIAIEALGKLHALGMLLLEKTALEDDSIVKQLDVNMMSFFTEPIMQIIETGMASFRDWMLNNDYDENALTNLEQELTEKNYLKTFRELFEEGEKHELRTIHHGDARANNILYRYADDNTTPVEVRIVDYQFTGVFNPFFDIVYFLAISLPSDLLIQHYPALLHRYHLSL